ncbi:MAG: tRNA (guanosine(37)-N1)-methyltransferase TrmD [Gemmatimonadetes bacterium]|nr:tRNA (guanosine(37)-N1)-methyltransferase TrmD [Gemmatimonadota bacterium]
MATSMMARAIARGLLTIETHDPRDCATDKHRTVDDAPYGGGGGMVLKPEPVYQLWQNRGLAAGRCIYLTADGQPLNQALAVELALEKRLVLLCGHYKGVDERIRTELIDHEISIGDYVLTGGEPAALVLIDAVARLIPNVLGNFFSALDDSFQEAVLDCPWYTRPVEFRGQRVPDALLSGDHERIEHWRRRQALRRTFARRPDLLQQIELDEEEQQLIATWQEQGLKEAP